MLSFLTKQKQNITNASNFTISSKTKTNYVTAHQVVETSNESTTPIFLKSHCNIRFNYNRFSGSTATTTTVRLRSHSTKNWFVKSGACAFLFMFCFSYLIALLVKRGVFLGIWYGKDWVRVFTKMEASATEEGKGIVLVQFHLMMYKFRRKKTRTGSEKKHPCLLTVRDSSVLGNN